MFKRLIIRHGDPDYENDCLTEVGKKGRFSSFRKISEKKHRYDFFFSVR